MKRNFIILQLLSIFIVSVANGQGVNNWLLHKVDSNFLFTEGPCWNNDDQLLFSDINANTIYLWNQSSGTTVFRNPSGNANGIATDVYGNLFIAQQGSRKVSKIDTFGVETTLAVLYNGDSLNSPNDIVVKSNGNIYFTDPPYGISAGEQQLSFCGVFLILPSNDSLVLLVDSLAKPNGITFSPDEQRLYVCNSINGKVYYYELKPDGTLKPGKLFVKVNSEIDGIKTDLEGNVYVAAAFNGIKIYSPLGILIDSIAVPEKTTNLAWGDKYRNTLYITAGTSVYSFHRNPNYPFILTELLSRPTDLSITLNMMPEENIEMYIEYGTQSGSYSSQTPVITGTANVPIVTVISGLNPNTKYYYRVRHRKQGSVSYLSRSEYSFCTQKSGGSNFVFDVHGDPHLDGGSNYTTYYNTLQHTLDDHPDFFIDLGDNFMSEKLPVLTYSNIEKRMLLLRHFYDKIGHSVPLYLVIGNHEAELGWLLDGTSDNEAIWAANARKKYYSNPTPGPFYTGDTSVQPYIGLRETYYSWTWGDALFVVLDPYWFTTVKPSQSKDMWDWTLGEDQYQWFKQTLESSTSKYKFVFCHQIIGGDTLGLGRGGIEHVPYYEMGGLNADSSLGFAANRPGWDKPIHQLMQDNCVNIFFHGHDHFYGKQNLDSVIYQEVPQPSVQNYTNTIAADFGYVQGVILPSAGHLRISVSDTTISVEYVRSYHADNPGNGWINGQISDSYTIHTCVGASIEQLASTEECQVFPNPASTSINIIIPNNRELQQIELIDIIGNCVHKGRSLLMDVSAIPNGLYFLIIKTSKTTFEKKILINH